MPWMVQPKAVESEVSTLMSGKRSLRSATMAPHLGDDLGMVLADIGDRVRLAHRNRNGDDMRAGLERHGGVAQVRHQRDHAQAGIVRACATTSAQSAICGSTFGETNEPTSISRRPGLRQRRDPAVLGRGRQRALDALQPVARADLADSHVHGRLRSISRGPDRTKRRRARAIGEAGATATIASGTTANATATMPAAGSPPIAPAGRSPAR